MMGWIFLAIKYIRYHLLKSIVLAGCVFLTALLPIAIEILLTQFESQIAKRAEQTPLVIGPRGSRFDLALNTLYFRVENAEEHSAATLPYREATEIENTGWAKSLPIYSKFTAASHPVVGVTPDYFDFRQLEIASGSKLVQIGDCVVGGAVAEQLGIVAGDKLLTDIQSVISIVACPLKMHVRGVLEPVGTADDWAVFVDLKTAWIIDGIGHGHQNLEGENEDLLLSKTDEQIVASAAVLTYTEINEANIDSFHFHGNNGDFPITSIIAVPTDQKSETILIGRYRNVNGAQLVVPETVIGELLNLVFKVKRLFDANALLIAISTVLLLVMIVFLSIKLREREMNTMFKMGASRHTVAMLQVAELSLIFLFSSILVALASVTLSQFSSGIIQSLLIGS